MWYLRDLVSERSNDRMASHIYSHKYYKNNNHNDELQEG